MTAPFYPPIPEPPSESFTPSDRVGQLVEITVLRVDHNYPDTFGRNNGNPVTAAYLNVAILAGAPDVGAEFREVPNSSILGRQLAGAVGQTLYGRLSAEKRGAGTSIFLSAPWPQDEPVIRARQAQTQTAAPPQLQGQPQPNGYPHAPQPVAAPQGQAQPPYGQPYAQPAPAPYAQPAPAPYAPTDLRQPQHVPPSFPAQPNVPQPPPRDAPPY